MRLTPEDKVCDREHPCIVRVLRVVRKRLPHHTDEEVEEQDVGEDNPDEIDGDLDW